MLYSNHLETFITVVESGSFRGAAEKIGISPSAVLKQISLLEQDLKVAVFDRSRRGVTLTEAGESIYRDSKYILKYCNGAAERARDLYTKQNRIIRIGVSVMNPPNHLAKIWENVYRINPEVKCRFVSFESTAAGMERAFSTIVKCRFVSFESTAAGMERAFSTIGQDCDVIAGVYDAAFLKKYDLKALHLFDISAVIGYAPGSFPQERIDSPEPLTFEELRGKMLQLPVRGTFKAIDDCRDDMLGLCPDISTEEFDMYCLEPYYKCHSSNYLILTYDIWPSGHLLVKTKDLYRTYTSSYGILYAENRTENIDALISAVKENAALPEGQTDT